MTSRGYLGITGASGIAGEKAESRRAAGNRAIGNRAVCARRGRGRGQFIAHLYRVARGLHVVATIASEGVHGLGERTASAMTDGQESVPDSGRASRPPWQFIVASVLRALGSTTALLAIYYVLPLDTTARWVAITILVIGLVLLGALTAFHVRSILRSRFPGLRAVEALATSVPLFLVLFAGAYVVMEHISSASFSQHLTHTDALYFTVTVVSTVGFGDITARTEAARILVTAQMILDVVIIGLAIQAVVSAARQARQRQSAKPLPPTAGSRAVLAVSARAVALAHAGNNRVHRG